MTDFILFLLIRPSRTSLRTSKLNQVHLVHLEEMAPPDRQVHPDQRDPKEFLAEMAEMASPELQDCLAKKAKKEMTELAVNKELLVLKDLKACQVRREI